MGAIDCIVNSKLADNVKLAELEAKVKSLVDNGKHPLEAERIVKNEFIAEQYEALNTELNDLKKSLGLPQSKLPPQEKSDTKQIEEEYDAKIGEIKEPPPPPPKEPPVAEKPEPSGRLNDKGVLSHLAKAKNIPEESRKGFEKEGLKYETKSQTEAEKVAKAVIDELGIDEAVAQAEAQKFDGDVNSLIFAESLNRLKEQEDKATTQEEKIAIADKFAQIGIIYDKMARYGGRFNSAINYFYKKSPLGIIMMENAKRKEGFDEWAKPKEKSWEEAYEEIKDLPEFKALVDKQVSEGMKKERSQTRKEKRDKVHKAIDDTMAKWSKKFSANLPQGTQKQGASIDVFKAAAATMKAAYDAGEAISKVVQDAIDYITKETGVKGWGEEDFRKEWTDKLSEKGGKKELTEEETKAKYFDKLRKKLKGLNESQKTKVIQKIYKEAVDKGALEFEDLRKIIAEAVGKSDLTQEEQVRLKELVGKTNAVEAAGEKVRTTVADESLSGKERETKINEAFKEFVKAQKEASEASKELNELFYNKTDIIKRLTSIMVLGTLGPVSLVVNVTYNLWNQLALRFPIGVFNTLMDFGLTKSAKLAGKTIDQEYNVIGGQAEFWNKLGLGLKESVEQVATGLDRMDYTQKEVFGQRIRPIQSWIDLYQNARGKKQLSRAQWWDKLIQGTAGVYSEAVARALNMGDKPLRFAAEGAQASFFAKGLGLKGIDHKVFIAFPREEAYRAYKAQGLSDAEASAKADVVEKAIIKEGQRAVFQQDNMLNDALSRVFGGKESSTGGLIKALTISPYIKIPSNAFWSYYNLINPEVAIVQAGVYAAKAHKLRTKGESVDARLAGREARYWLAHAVVGMSMRAVVLAMVEAGLFTPAADEDDSKKERDALSYYDKGGTTNIGGAKISNRWFAQFGMMGNAIAKKHKDMTPEQKEAQETFWNTIFGGMEVDALSELENGIFANSSSLLQAYSTRNPDRYLMNTVNLLSNIVQPGGVAQINRAAIENVTSNAGDSFTDKLNQNFAQRSTLYRRIFDVQLNYKRDIWGQRIPKEGNVLLRMMGISKADPQVFARPIYNDYLRTMDAGFLPPVVYPNLGDVKLNTEQHDRLQDYVGSARKALVEPYVNGALKLDGFNVPYSQLTSDSDRKFVLDKFYEWGRAEGLAKLYKDYPELMPKSTPADFVDQIKKELFLELQKIKLNKL